MTPPPPKARKQEKLLAAKKAKNNEFYTQLKDIENELQHYTEHFRDKIVYCNCDDYRTSQFVAYFKREFSRLGLKRLISTHHVYVDLFTDATAYKYEFDGKTETVTPLKGDGDFRSEECLALLDEADIVVTNPPFSLFREFVSTMEAA